MSVKDKDDNDPLDEACDDDKDPENQEELLMVIKVYQFLLT